MPRQRNQYPRVGGVIMLGVIWGACVAAFFWSIVTTIAVMATKPE